jgi:hypothetical protein
MHLLGRPVRGARFARREGRSCERTRGDSQAGGAGTDQELPPGNPMT